MTHPRIPARSPRLPRLLTAPVGAAALAALLAAGAIGCSSSSATGVPASGHSSGSSQAAGSSASARPIGAPGSAVVLDEHSAGRTVKVGVGTSVEVDLHSAYWSSPRSSDAQVLQQVGQGKLTKGTGCPPGAGCGTVQARFTAQHAGTATLTASRTSCGEAMACPPGGRSFTVTIDVVMAG